MTLLQLGGTALAIALAGIVRGVIIPRYQAWVVQQVRSGRWTMLQAQKFDHRVSMAIWLPFAFAVGIGWGIVIWAWPLMMRC